MEPADTGGWPIEWLLTCSGRALSDCITGGRLESFLPLSPWFAVAPVGVAFDLSAWFVLALVAFTISAVATPRLVSLWRRVRALWKFLGSRIHHV